MLRWAGRVDHVDRYRTALDGLIGQIGGYGRITAPPDLAPYGNGRIPAAALEPVGQGGHRLAGPAARAWKACVEAARADGIDLTITDSYRSFDQQVDLVQRKGLYSNGGFGATPGASNHGWGLAVDAKFRPRNPQLDAQQRVAFGFVEAVPREPWPGNSAPTRRDRVRPGDSRPPCHLRGVPHNQSCPSRAGPKDWDHNNPHTRR